MNDIDKAIKELEDLAYHPSIKKELSGKCIALAINALKQQKSGYINQKIIAKAQISKSYNSFKLRKLIADALINGDMKLIRCGDKLNKQGYMNKLMRDVEGEDN